MSDEARPDPEQDGGRLAFYGGDAYEDDLEPAAPDHVHTTAAPA